MQKYDKEFLINETQEKYDSCKSQLMCLVEKHHEISQGELTNQLCEISEMICYYGDLLDVLKE